MTRQNTTTSLLPSACGAALAAVFVFAGAVKLTLAPPIVARFAEWGYASWLTDLIGIVEIVGGILILIPITAFIGASALAGLVIGMGYMHLLHGSGIEVLPFAAFLLALAIVIWYRRPGPRWMRRSLNGRIRYQPNTRRATQ